MGLTVDIGQKLQDRLYELHIDSVYPKKAMTVIAGIISLQGKFKVIGIVPATGLKGHNM